MSVRRALAAAAALLALAVAHEPQLCSESLFGSSRGVAVPLPQLVLPPADLDFSIRVPDFVCSPLWRQVGTRMRVCDEGAPPYVQWSNAFMFYVRRYGGAAGAALVLTTVYCVPDAGPTPAETATDLRPTPAGTVPDHRPTPDRMQSNTGRTSGGTAPSAQLIHKQIDTMVLYI